uniref:Putative U-box domain-containing protein 42 n=1 Tax=Lygus hesperus TaxID=30085 RepID=A0A0A9Z4Y8_LYGHE
MPVCREDGTQYQAIQDSTIRTYVLENVLPKVLQLPQCENLNHRDSSYTAILRESVKLYKIVRITVQEQALSTLFQQLQNLLFTVSNEYIEAWMVIFNNPNTTNDVLVASLYDLYKIHLSSQAHTDR